MATITENGSTFIPWHRCCLCGQTKQGHGNDAWPLSGRDNDISGACCDGCFPAVLATRHAIAMRQDAGEIIMLSDLDEIREKIRRRFWPDV